MCIVALVDDFRPGQEKGHDMKLRKIDQDVFIELQRNHISYWPDVRSYGLELAIRKGERAALYNGAIVENTNGRLILVRASDGSCKCKATAANAVECKALQEYVTVDEILPRYECKCPCHSRK